MFLDFRLLKEVPYPTVAMGDATRGPSAKAFLVIGSRFPLAIADATHEGISLFIMLVKQMLIRSTNSIHNFYFRKTHTHTTNVRTHAHTHAENAMISN